MRRIISLLAIIAIVVASNCSRVPENNDPVIGIWAREESKISGQTRKQTLRQEWIFNDAYLGRYHRYEGEVLNFKTDFSWEQEDGQYTISYPGTTLQTDVVRMKTQAELTLLTDEAGNILATRE